MVRRMLTTFLLCVLIVALFGCGKDKEKADADATTEIAEDTSEQAKGLVGLFPVSQNGKWGYIDKTGKIVIKLQFDAAWTFSEGLAKVRAGRTRGYIDKTGKIVIKPQFDETRPFSGGLAMVMVRDEQGYDEWGYIDKTGKYVWEPTRWQ